MLARLEAQTALGFCEIFVWQGLATALNTLPHSIGLCAQSGNLDLSLPKWHIFQQIINGPSEIWLRYTAEPGSELEKQ